MPVVPPIAHRSGELLDVRLGAVGGRCGGSTCMTRESLVTAPADDCRGLLDARIGFRTRPVC